MNTTTEIQKKRYLVGIDPDLKLNGCAVWDRHEKRFISITCMDMLDLQEMLLSYPHDHTMVVLEAGWLITKANWHNSGRGAAAERTAKNVGENHACGKLIMAFCIKKNIAYILVKPRGKIGQPLFKTYTAWPKLTNQEERDAAMLVFGY